MTPQQILNTMVRRICDVTDPDQIILFGSQARGSASPSSDYDLLVIQDSDEPRYRRSAPLYAALATLPEEIDVIVYTPEEVKDWSEVDESFISTAIREGQVLYEKKG